MKENLKDNKDAMINKNKEKEEFIYKDNER